MNKMLPNTDKKYLYKKVFTDMKRLSVPCKAFVVKFLHRRMKKGKIGDLFCKGLPVTLSRQAFIDRIQLKASRYASHEDLQV